MYINIFLFRVMHKIRESLLNNRAEFALSGDLQMAEAYVDDYVRNENKKEEQVNRRMAENQRFDAIHGKFDTKRINHQKAYSYEDGIPTNCAESYLSSFCRMQYEQIHKFDNMYLINYTNEAAYSEDNRRMNNGDMFDDILKKCTKTRTSQKFGRYWHDNRKLVERLAG